MRSMSIVTQGLKKDYGPVEALKGVDLEIGEGGVVGLLGPNGAGKTTLVEILEGLRLPTAGSARVLDLDPTTQTGALKERIGVQLQSTAMPLDLTARELLQMYAAFYAKSLPVDDVLARVGLTSKAGALNRSLSGGQRQRLALGIALIHDPELLILDEPTAGLDPAARRALHEVIREFQRTGHSVILTTHYIEEAEDLCERVIVLRSGEVVADGTPFDLIGRAQGASTMWIAFSGPFDPHALEAAGAVHQGVEGAHHRFATRDPAAVIVALGDMLKSQKVTLTDLRMKRPTLEDVYLELVGEDEMSALATPAAEARAAVQEVGARALGDDE
jgi:ABC-2 type transport system ATP-binding protein